MTTRSVGRHVSVALCLAASLLATGHPAAADPARTTAVTGPPVLNAPVFNDPTADSDVPGTPSAAQSAVMDQLIRLIQAVQPGGDIRFVMHQFSTGQRSSEVANALVAAHERGVRVKVILDSREDASNDAVEAQLTAALGTSESAGSWVVGCEYPDPSAENRGCIARNYQHNKFALFSNVLVGGTLHPKVGFQTSSNLSDWYLYNSYNDAYTFTDATVYDGYLTYFDDLRAGRRTSVNPGYFWTTPTGTPIRAMFFPRRVSSGDPVVNILRLVECSYQTPDGVTRQTDIRMALTAFNKNRKAIADELLRLRGKNCWIDIVFYENAGNAMENVDSEIRKILGTTASNGKKMQVTPCRFTVGSRSVVPHTKLMLLDGFYDDDITPRVYTGSANFTYLENADDAWLRLSGRDLHDRYEAWFKSIRGACGGPPPS
ncbi:phospholipase D-like domain-containing protein [Nonomuraea sp. KM88]|uniref:phospholipase D-like domain-containing protein n=1 Tax=Nonomuraea sp. KM88 TaxID=3457427 RepID=UPI003FCE66C1